MERIPIYEEYRLIEKRESEINGAWKGAHILLFFLAFVFGSFCTFCFHMLMYLFDEKCVLFPKLLSLSSIRHNIIYEFLPPEKDLLVDFLSTQWVDKSACYLPTYVPLMSGIFGLVWTTMFLMCSTGSRTLTGLQRPWRVLPPVFVFSLVIGGLCTYTSAVTHYGLEELCLKLAEFTGSSTYTINVATLAYERRIRGVYQATRLTIVTAWLHTACWLLSALLTLARVLLAVDFQLVCVRAELNANIDKMLEKHEKQIRTISPEVRFRFEDDDDTSYDDLSIIDTQLFYNTKYEDRLCENDNYIPLIDAQADMLYLSDGPPKGTSEMSLVPAEQSKLARLLAYQSVPKDKKFIVKLIYDLVDNIDLQEIMAKGSDSNWSMSSKNLIDKSQAISRQYGQELLSSKIQGSAAYDISHEYVSINLYENEEIGKEIRHTLLERLDKILLDQTPRHEIAMTSKNSLPNINSELKEPVQQYVRENINKKSTTKLNSVSIGVQTDKKKKRKESTHKVHISESKSIYDHESLPSIENIPKGDKETQTGPKEKQD